MPDEERSLELAPGLEAAVQFEIPSTGRPVHPRLVLEGDGPRPDFTGWRVKDHRWGEATEWVAAEPGGGVAVDVSLGAPRLQVEDPGGARWVFDVPPTDEEGYPLVIPRGPAAYTGRLEAWHDGAPLAGVRVFAIPMGPGATRTSAVSDGDGRFRLAGLRPIRYRLDFSSDAAGFAGGSLGGALRHLSLFPAAGASPGGTELAVRLPVWTGAEYRGLERTTVAGVVRDGAGTPVSRAWLSVYSRLEQPAGELTLLHVASVFADAGGRYAIEVVRAPRYRATLVHPDDRDRSATAHFEDVPGALRIEQALVLP